MEEESSQYKTLQLILNQKYLCECANDMPTIKTNIVKLGTIFNRLAIMVKKYCEMVEWRKDSVEDDNQ
eukprot:13391760-Ditylum_brightwellii.AAC.1